MTILGEGARALVIANRTVSRARGLEVGLEKTGNSAGIPARPLEGLEEAVG